MWIQYSCGSFTHTHSATAVHEPEPRRDQRDGIPAQRISAYTMKKYSNVFGNTISIVRAVEQLEHQHPDEPVIEEELADAEGGVARPVAHHRGVGDREVVDVERLVDALVRPVGPEVDIGERGEQRVVDRVEDERDDDDQLVARNQQRDSRARRRDDDRARGQR